MTDNSIYKSVKEELLKHGLERTKSGLLTLHDKRLFLLFVDLERAMRKGSFSGVQSVTVEIENHLISIGKRHLMAYTYLYLIFSDLTPKKTEYENLPDGGFRKTMTFTRKVTEEEILIGNWAIVKEHALGPILYSLFFDED